MYGDGLPSLKELSELPLIFELDITLFESAEEEGRTEEPTEYRIRKAREEGKVPKSQELVSSILILITVWGIALLGSYLYDEFAKLIPKYFSYISEVKQHSLVSLNNVLPALVDIGLELVYILLPILMLTFVVAFLAGAVQTNFLFTTKPLNPDWARLNFFKNFRRIFISRETLFNLAKSIFKIAVVGIITYVLLEDYIDELYYMTFKSPGEAFTQLNWFQFKLVTVIGIFMILMSILDFIYQKFEHKESLKMTRHEFKEELKDTEGDPYLKARLRDYQKQIAFKQMLKNVKESTVVVTNPTHIAIALKYEYLEMEAPVVVAKGRGKMAEKIIQIAKENGVYIHRDPPLAWAMYDKVQVGEEIPVEFYEVIAELIAFVYKLKQKEVV